MNRMLDSMKRKPSRTSCSYPANDNASNACAGYRRITERLDRRCQRNRPVGARGDSRDYCYSLCGRADRGSRTSMHRQG